MNHLPIYGIGLMCGTSHDGLDIACVEFDRNEHGWVYNLIESNEIPLSESLKQSLDDSTKSSGLQLAKLDADFARFSAEQVNIFCEKYQIAPEFIASHGVTIFHDPRVGITTQIGSGAIISALTQTTTISDFRTQDVAKGGNGAPLVPFADSLLFSEFDYSLNLGGFANVSALRKDALIGFDIAPCNLLLNHIANKIGLNHDEGGELARMGTLIDPLLHSLNKLPYYEQKPPKSLGYEWFEDQILPIIPNESPADLLHTACEHIAIQIGKSLHSHGSCIVTGGGAFNDYLIERIRHYVNCDIVIPDPQIIRFKEAICFAFLGLLRLRQEKNISSTVTGATSDSIAGAIYIP
ncbi:MAG: anhydro-N-acetylmuramic acid kinase [Flavobacteriales bacterium]